MTGKAIIRCAHCAERRRGVTLWRQIVGIAPDAVCCWIDSIPEIPQKRGSTR